MYNFRNPIFSSHDNRVYGMEEILRRMNSLPDKLRDKGLKQAVSAAATPVVQATKAALTRERTGLLRESLTKVVLKSYNNMAGWVALIGARRMTGIKKRGIQNLRFIGKKVKKRLADQGISIAYPTRYLHLIEKGTKHSKAYPFMMHGLDTSKDVAFGVMRNKLMTFLAEEFGK